MYRIVRRYYMRSAKRVIARGLTLEEAQEHCIDPETSSSTCVSVEKVAYTKRIGPWFDAYERE